MVVVQEGQTVVKGTTEPAARADNSVLKVRRFRDLAEVFQSELQHITATAIAVWKHTLYSILTYFLSDSFLDP